MKHELTSTDAGSQRTAHVGDTFEVTLRETPTTGYTWQPEFDAQELEQISDERRPSSPAPGAEGIRVFTFRTLRPGEATLRITKRRGWGSEAPEEFAVRLTIIPAAART